MDMPVDPSQRLHELHFHELRLHAQRLHELQQRLIDPHHLMNPGVLGLTP